MADWEIKKTIGQCSGTGREFAVDEEYFAALVETPEGFVRQDFSAEYWDEHKPAGGLLFLENQNAQSGDEEKAVYQ